MNGTTLPSVDWVVLSTGERPEALAAAIESLRSTSPRPGRIIVLSNGGGDLAVADDDVVRVVASERNLGIPGGRHRALHESEADVVGFLDDDARMLTLDLRPALDAFVSDPQLAVVSLRIVDEQGETSRRHLPRPGLSDPEQSGVVTLFLGGACLIRRRAYDDVGGYFGELFYGHEELELSWRLADRGWSCFYRADVKVFHPRTDISRHARGWYLTGRNRVLIARRTLPWVVASSHVVFWLVMGTWRAPDTDCRRAYTKGWAAGWRLPVERRPIRWRTVGLLGRRGRVPAI